ncbi:PIR Superfamily Protein [Plasmodium ovale curtisi]|uniref:PIR Superfamily Protein n=1 Tax=Plasmodium ovale curtisi TaxID=864141 RepID=A0A1A8X5L5_PLAOA|nr:PIR Superfamily Protein [Plasmodium ovale curtisi]
MGCDTELYRKNYEFFNSIDEYIKYDELAEKNGDNNIHGMDYSFINIFNEQKFVDLKKLCNRFVYLVDALRKRNEGSTFNADYDFDYLNYWLNARIHEIDDEGTCKKLFFQNLRSRSNEILIYSDLSSGMYDIQENELKDMNILYKLHKDFKELNEKINESTPKEEEYMIYAKNCVQDYQKLKNKCTEVGAKFCKILTNFKDKYEEIDLCKHTFEGKMRKKLPSLESDPNKEAEVCKALVIDKDVPSPQDRSVYSESDEGSFDIDTQSITIGSVATVGMSIIFVMLYKFTSIGQFLRSQMNKNERVWENLDEEMNPFSHSSEYEHFNSENKMYGIAYNS